jgi:hypothetical protein
MRLARRMAVQRKAPFALGHILGTGQSLSTGTASTNTPTTVQPFSNVMLFDSSGTYPTSGAFETTLSLVPLVSPQRPIAGVGSQQYPSNINGESPDIAFANQLTTLALQNRVTSFGLATTCAGQGGAGMSSIQKGGTSNCYLAGVYEVTEIEHVFGSAGFLNLAVLLTHGETDADIFNASYQSQLVTLQSNYQADLAAPASPFVTMVISQQNSNPTAGTGPNLSAIAQWQAAVANPGKIILACPKYQYNYTAGQHLTDYRPLGEKCAQAFWQEYLFRHHGIGAPWVPLWPTAFSRTGAVVTITFNVPRGPLRFDQTVAGPHLPGSGLAAWAQGRGLEAWDATQTITAATNASPIVLTVSSTSGYTTGQTGYVEGVLGNTNANGAHVVTVVDGTHLSLNGTTGNGAFSAGAGGASVKNIITISSAVISGSQVTLTLARSPTGSGATGLFVGYARHSDFAYNTLTGGFSLGRCGLLLDSDLFVGRSGVAQPNRCIEFEQQVA